MRAKRAGLVATVGACIVLALLAVFALELSDTQTKSRNEVKSQLHDRAVLAAALIDSLLQTIQQQIPQDSKTYGGATVPASTLDAAVQQDVYLALLGPGGEVIAASKGFNEQARAQIVSSTALALLHGGHPYGLGDYAPYGTSGVIDFAVSFPTAYGTRTLVTGFAPQALDAFVTGELKTIPGVRGADNYLVDGRGVVLASTSVAAPVGRALAVRGSAAGLSRPAVDSQGVYFDQVILVNSHWRIVLSAPDGPLFATVTGWHQLVPWVIFGAFALVAIIALILGLRVLIAADKLRDVNVEIARVNLELSDANSSLEQRAAELARSNEELDQFASIASHDLQEPLRKVRTFTQQLAVMEGDRVSEKGLEYLERANAAAERMQRLIEDLLRFSRVSTQGRPMAEVDLNGVVAGVVSDLDAQISETRAVLHVGSLPTITADPLQMQQLFQNLISNAIKFRRDDVVPEIEVTAALAGDNARITVSDNGIGFESRYSLRIFRVFERLHGRSEYPGTGIGLALCRKIADRHGGTIQAVGEPGVGSRFIIELPMTHHHQPDETVATPLMGPVPEFGAVAQRGPAAKSPKVESTARDEIPADV